MDHRYLVTYKHWNGNAVQAITTTLGRFWDRDTAERHAKEKFGVSGYEFVSVRAETAFEANRYKVYRFFVRLTRITCAVVAVVVGFFAYAWLHDSGMDTGDIPLASLTGNMISSNLMRAALVIAAIPAAWLCWVLAFGAGPDN